MSPKKIFLLMFSLAYTVKYAAADTLHNNYFCSLEGKISFERADDSDWYKITKGQHLEGVFQGTDKNKNCINVRAGRKNDKDNISWVEEKSSQIGINLGNPIESDMVTNATSERFDNMNLNFAIKGTLTYEDDAGSIYKCPNVIIAQTGTQWWDDNLWEIFNTDKDNPHSLACYNYYTNKPLRFVLSPGGEAEDKPNIIKFKLAAD